MLNHFMLKTFQTAAGLLLMTAFPFQVVSLTLVVTAAAAALLSWVITMAITITDHLPQVITMAGFAFSLLLPSTFLSTSVDFLFVTAIVCRCSGLIILPFLLRSTLILSPSRLILILLFPLFAFLLHHYFLQSASLLLLHLQRFRASAILTQSHFLSLGFQIKRLNRLNIFHLLLFNLYLSFDLLLDYLQNRRVGQLIHGGVKWSHGQVFPISVPM